MNDQQTEQLLRQLRDILASAEACENHATAAGTACAGLRLAIEALEADA